ncbi:MAG: pantoate--beta-alanine ligase [Alphaproteobacteria bacterium]|nr:pantoate--beta-alanine ligase [Alphaproteobacteria bacterium]MDE2494562.1 pantoate--beta-alanine ligase [Alphaproteobacteria bacterium]
MPALPIVATIAQLRASIAAARQSGARIGFVPTMGALHDGHLSLVHETQKRADKVVVSIFVNPTQFAPHEDFGRYPRMLEADTAKLASAGGTDLIFAPSISEMYPEGFATKVDVSGPSHGLETDFRPHFFAGVGTVVAKLLLAAMPDIATFGEKDYQQLLVVRRLAIDLGLTVEIFGAPIVREPDGLAMSSRNAYLKPDERKIAGQLNAVLKRVIAALRGGEPIPAAEMEGKHALLKAGFASVDYVAVRDAASLASLDTLSHPARILAAAKVGATRLIDNMAV